MGSGKLLRELQDPVLPQPAHLPVARPHRLQLDPVPLRQQTLGNAGNGRSHHCTVFRAIATTLSLYRSPCSALKPICCRLIAADPGTLPELVKQKSEEKE